MTNVASDSKSRPDDLWNIINEIIELTGEDPHLYTTRPGDGNIKYVFKDAIVAARTEAEALAKATTYATSLLTQARANKKV